MKKQAVFIAAIFSALACFCQNQDEGTETENKLRLGIRAGLAIADNQLENNQNLTDHSFKPGGIIGVFVRTPLNNTLYFQPELTMVGKGTKDEEQYYDNRIDLTYLELPLLLLYKSSKVRGAFIAGGGPAPSILIGENIFYYGNQYSKTFDFGVNVQAGYEIPIGFSICLSYTHGLLNISSNKEAVMKNRCFGLTLGYLFK